jgi:natural product precursor
MKKTKQIKLQLVRDVVRALQSHELQQVEGGNARGQTGDSKNVCCA